MYDENHKYLLNPPPYSSLTLPANERMLLPLDVRQRITREVIPCTSDAYLWGFLLFEFYFKNSLGLK